jgi:hypothetical protein
MVDAVSISVKHCTPFINFLPVARARAPYLFPPRLEIEHERRSDVAQQADGQSQRQRSHDNDECGPSYSMFRVIHNHSTTSQKQSSPFANHSSHAGAERRSLKSGKK